MKNMFDQPLARLVRRLESVVTLSPDDRNVLARLPVTIRSFDANRDIVRQGEFASFCCIVFSGQLVRNKITDSSRRQIVSFHLREIFQICIACTWGALTII